ncbi:YDG/SRA domain-containing protein [Vibrio parahaemolyticus]
MELVEYGKGEPVKYELDASNRLKNLMQLSAPMSVADIQSAIERFEVNNREAETYADSTGYDLIYQDKRYPPKAIFGMALSSILDDPIYSHHFTGGLGSECFKVLTRLKFEIVSKSGKSINEIETFLIEKPAKELTGTKRPIIIGEIPGFDIGRHFETRKEMMPSSFHRVWTSGIDGNGNEGTAAIVLSGGYSDDADYGDEIIYTGAGGNKDGKQISDQSWSQPGNAGLLTSMDQGLPVRVVRGHKHKSERSPKSGYVYAGLYNVVDAWEEKGKEGFKICRFRLVFSDQNLEPKIAEPSLDYTKKPTERRTGTVLRIARDTEKSRQIKKLYAYQCQVCGTAIRTKSGFYAEGAHIKPVGRPHDGDDSVDNLLCLCPNHHVMFDKGMFAVADDYTLLGDAEGKLTVNSAHYINLENFSYHRIIHGYD